LVVADEDHMIFGHTIVDHTIWSSAYYYDEFKAFRALKRKVELQSKNKPE